MHPDGTGSDRLGALSTASMLSAASLTTPKPRERSYTLDGFNISSIEGSKSARRDRTSGEDSNFAGHLETATWVFSDILLSLSIRDKDDARVVVTKSNQLVSLLRENPSLKQEIAIEHVVSKIQFMLYHPTSQFRCAVYRILRYATGTQSALLHLVKLRILIYIIVSLSTPTPQLEKEEALKLVRHFTSMPNGADCISIGVIKALVALVESENEDVTAPDHERLQSHISPSFTRMCIETICEIAVCKQDIVFHGGGLRLLIQLIVNGLPDIASSCLVTIMTLLDMSEARLFLRNGFDLDSLMSVFSAFEDDDEGNAPNTKKYRNRALKISFLLTLFLKTWTGLICFSHNKFDALKVLLGNLRKRNNEVRNMILDILLDVLRIKTLPWLEESTIGDVLAQFFNFMNKSNGTKNSLMFEYRTIPHQNFEFGIISHYQGLLLKVFFNCDLLPLLFDIINENRDEETTCKATYLLTNIFQQSVNFLPQEFYNEHILHAYDARLSVTSIAKIEAACRLQQKGEDLKRNAEVRNVVKELSIQARQNIDDTQFKTAINNTKVLTFKEIEEWNWNAISQLFQGPLRDPKRFSEVQEKYPKFLKTIFSFLRPFKYRFSNLPLHANAKFPKLKNPKRIILITCQMLEAFLTFDEGAKFLDTCKLMPQIAEIYAQLDPFSGIRAKEPILSTKRLENTLSVGYIKFFGILSSCSRGCELLNHWQLVLIVSNIVEGSAEDDNNNYLIFNLLDNIDYTFKSPVRLILSKAMSVSNWKIKLFALERIFPSLINEKDPELATSILSELLYDESEVVVSTAVNVLHKYFITQGNLDKIDLLINSRPSIPVLSKSSEGKLLLMNFCKTSKGFKHLHQHGFIEKYFQDSVNQLQTFEYLNAVEISLRIHFYPYVSMIPNASSIYDKDLHHFFYYLLSTEDGYNFFHSRRQCVDDLLHKIKSISARLNLIDGDSEPEAILGYDATEAVMDEVLEYDENPFDSPNGFNDGFNRGLERTPTHSLNRLAQGVLNPSLASVTKEEAMQYEDEYLMRKLKQSIWVVGEIASATYGMQLLDPINSGSMGYGSEHIAETFNKLYQHANNWQLRGLAFYQLGKMATTVEGVEILDDLRWVSLDNHDVPHPVPLAYPMAMQEDDFFNIEILNPYKDASYFTLFGGNEGIHVDLDLEDDVVVETYEELDEKILGLINYLSSVLGRIERKAMKELNRIKLDNPQVFSDLSLFLRTIRLVDKGKFKYRTRVFIFELFNTQKIMENLMKRDRKLSTGRKTIS